MSNQPQLQAELGSDLYTACKTGQLQTLTSILSSQRSKDASYEAPLSAIMTAATTSDHEEIVLHCLEQGAVVTDALMVTLICSEAFNTHKALIEAKAVDINHFIPWFSTVLGIVAPEGKLEWTKFCLENGADVTKAVVDYDKTVLAASAENGHIDVVALLLEHGAVMKGSGAIVLAAEAGRKDMVEFLLEKGADVDEIGIDSTTDERIGEDAGSALHRAAEGGYREVVDLLIQKGANVFLEDMKGRTAVELARDNGHEEIIELLRADSLEVQIRGIESSV